jgi:L-rhamnose mutarotase
MNPVSTNPFLGVFLHGIGAGFAATCYTPQKQVKRYGSVIGLRPEKLEEYKKLHAAVWPDVLKMIRACHIQNYSIYLRRLDDGRYYLFSYFEYTGSNFAADLAKMAADPATQRWWSVCEPCQQPLADRAPDERWVTKEEVFHQD